MFQKIALHSVPRSGSSWLGKILDSSPDILYKYQPLFSYALKSFLNKNSTKEEIDLFFKKLTKKKDDFLDQKSEKKDGIIPEFQKSAKPTILVYKEVRYHYILSNLLFKDKEVKVIGLIRNPFSVIYSWLKAPKEFKAELGWKTEQEWKFAPSKNQNKPEEFNGYEKWKEVSYLFLQLKEQYPGRFYLLSYEDLIQNPFAETSKLFEFANLEFSEQTQEFLKDSTSRNDKDPYSVYKTKDRIMDWENKLPEYIIQEIKNDREFQELNQIFHWL
jgi:hypothetical protein